MSEAAEAVLTAAMSLTDAERQELALHLMHSLPPGDDWEEVSEEELHAEVLRRHEEALRDPSVCVSAEEVHTALEQMLRAEHVETQG